MDKEWMIYQFRGSTLKGSKEMDYKIDKERELTWRYRQIDEVKITCMT